MCIIYAYIKHITNIVKIGIFFKKYLICKISVLTDYLCNLLTSPLHCEVTHTHHHSVLNSVLKSACSVMRYTARLVCFY